MTLTHLSSLATGAAPALANHLWQSTAFTAAIGLLTLLLRRNHARIRHTLWLAASIKFLLPFSLLITLGTLLPKPRQIAPPTTIYSAIDTASQPFTQFDTPIAPAPATPTLKDRLTAQLPAALSILWLCGALTVLLLWYTRWRQVRATLKRSTPITQGRELEILRRLQTQSRTAKPITLLRSPDLMEPGIFGILRPTLLWPHRLSDQLEDQHIEAILAHETIHVQRRDNLTAALHMLVEAVFWFHPIVWWMERRMIEERERACDEAVVQQGGNPEAYAESLLKACRFCLESPLPCIAGITGADLSRRVRSIMTLQLEEMSLSKKLVLTTLIFATLAGPVAFGIVHMIPTYGQILHANGPLPSFEVATIRPWKRMTLGPLPAPSGEKIIHQDTMKVSPNGGSGQISDRVHLILPIEGLITLAYNLPPSSKRVLGGPDWMRQDIDQYVIQAKIEASQFAAMQKMTPAQQHEQVALMEQSLLADRFKLKVHFETREMPGYALVIAKGGPKLTSAKDSESNNLSTLSGEQGATMTATAVTLDQFVHSPALLGGALIVDQTGLKGAYDFTLNWQRDQLAPPDAGQQNAPDAPVLFTAIQQQLGLKLIPTKAPVEVLVIDHIEQPSSDPGGEAPPTPTKSETPAPKSLTFEVVSVRQSKPDSKVRVETLPNGYSETNLPLKAIISNAYGIRQDLISGAPGWTESTAYDIEAKEDESVAAAMQKLSTKEQGAQTRLMLQAVLADRFHLKATQVTKEAPIYQLVIAKGALKLKEADPKNTYANGIKGLDGVGTGVILTGSGQVIGQAIPMSMLAANLAYQVDRSVVDRTGLTGKYDFTLKWAPEGPNGAPAPDDSRPSLFTALQEQLGLKLEPTKGPVESLVIDHIERPSEN